MTEQKKDFPEFYVTSAQPCPYLAGRMERKLFTHLTPDKPAALVDNLLKGGFRRSQNIAYTPYCEGCQACVSVRVLVDSFQPSRNMRRVAKAYRDVVASRHLAEPTSEQYDLFRSYIDCRHSDGGMADMSVLDFAQMIEDSLVNTFITEYRDREPLIPDTPGPHPERLTLDGTIRPTTGKLRGVALSDRLSDGISMVYSFYDIDDVTDSFGTYMILEHIEYARTLGLPYVYLGYWINGSRKMRYKTRFLPQEHLGSNGWASYERPADEMAHNHADR